MGISLPRMLTIWPKIPRFYTKCDPEVHLFENDGSAVLFDTNSLVLVQVDPNKAKKYLDSKGFVGLLHSHIAPVFRRASVAPTRKIVLNVTHGCNLACTYCFASEYPREGIMNLDTAARAIELFDPKTRIDISFFGGEPLLAWDVMMGAVEIAYQRSQGKNRPKLHVTTNGTLIDKMKASALKRYGFSVLLSLDGPEDIHNASRPARHNDKGTSFEQTMNGLKELNKVGIKPFCRATFSSSSPGMRKRLNFFADLYDKEMITGVSIEPAVLAEGCGSTPKAKPDKELLQAEWHEAAKWFVERIKAGKPFPYFFYKKLLSRLLNCQHHGADCGAGRGYLTIGPTGKVFACHREEGSEIGDLDTGFDAEKRKPWWDNCVTAYSECRKCWARYICGGGCPQNRTTVGGSFEGKMPHVCAVRKMLFQEVFWIASQLTEEEAIKAIK